MAEADWGRSAMNRSLREASPAACAVRRSADNPVSGLLGRIRRRLSPGGVPEWLNGAVSKTVGVARRSWVRIPPPPLSIEKRHERLRSWASRAIRCKRIAPRGSVLT
jgi:hypothetical protein